MFATFAKTVVTNKAALGLGAATTLAVGTCTMRAPMAPSILRKTRVLLPGIPRTTPIPQTSNTPISRPRTLAPSCHAPCPYFPSPPPPITTQARVYRTPPRRPIASKFTHATPLPPALPHAFSHFPPHPLLPRSNPSSSSSSSSSCSGEDHIPSMDIGWAQHGALQSFDYSAVRRGFQVSPES